MKRESTRIGPVGTDIANDVRDNLIALSFTIVLSHPRRLPFFNDNKLQLTN